MVRTFSISSGVCLFEISCYYNATVDTKDCNKKVRRDSRQSCHMLEGNTGVASRAVAVSSSVSQQKQDQYQ